MLFAVSVLAVSGDSDPKTMVDKCIRLCKEHHFSPCSYPYLSLNRHVLESVLMHATAGAGSTTDFRFARQLSRLVLRGLEAIYPMGHPVRAIQHVMLARLLGLGENQGEQITDIPNLRIAYEQMKIAHGEVRIAYGKDEVKGSVLTGKTMAPLVDIRKDTEAQLKALERDIAWRETAYRDMKERR